MYDGVDHYPHEEHVAGALKNLLDSPVRVGLLTGHGERSFTEDKETDFKTAFYGRVKNNTSLLNLGFTDMVELNLSKQAHNMNEIDILVVADPLDSLTSQEISELQRYISKGKNLLLAVEPNNKSGLVTIFNQLGIEQLPGQLLTAFCY